MTFIVSLLVGLAGGWFITYAVDFHARRNRILAASIVGALVGGWLVPWILRFPGFWSALILGVVGLLLAIWLTSKAFKSVF